MSSGTPRSRTSVTWGIWWLASAAEKDGERGGRFPIMRQEHLLGMLGRSHSPAQDMAEERKKRRRLDLGHVLCKKESRITVDGGQIIYI